ncbi:MAG: hypothetical protein EOO50_07995 [Flavobacterium sp.]|uniref:hypothetical protein n=1 Tax=Flavobacterium sp. TaxID=239 RepID=UPI0012038DE1|nr:hypothetical protein [Flavobacterium sp.]RZJ66820.1 MAG: hypothetical protein EOO50_07995 [Flavobacterium sp.]
MTAAKAIFDKNVIERLIPQKFPFVMVDKLFSFTDETIEAGLTIPDTNIFCHDGTFRESGLIEHMAQSVALHTGYKFYLLNEPAPTGYIGSINQLQISELPKVGQEIKTLVTIIQEFGGITLVDLVTTRNDIEIARGQMKTVLAK